MIARPPKKIYLVNTHTHTYTLIYGLAYVSPVFSSFKAKFEICTSFNIGMCVDFNFFLPFLSSFRMQ